MADQAPLPLDIIAASRQALRLRARGLSYADIAVVMSVYHGHVYGEHHWRKRCRVMGAPAMPRGYGRRTVAA